MLLRRKPSTHGNPTIIPTFALGSATRISSAAPMTAGSELTTAGSMRLGRDRLSHSRHVNLFYVRRAASRAKLNQVVPELAAVKPQQPLASDEEHRVIKFRPRAPAHPPGWQGALGRHAVQEEADHEP